MWSPMSCRLGLLAIVPWGQCFCYPTLTATHIGSILLPLMAPQPQLPDASLLNGTYWSQCVECTHMKLQRFSMWVGNIPTMPSPSGIQLLALYDNATSLLIWKCRSFYARMCGWPLRLLWHELTSGWGWGAPSWYILLFLPHPTRLSNPSSGKHVSSLSVLSTIPTCRKISTAVGPSSFSTFKSNPSMSQILWMSSKLRCHSVESAFPIVKKSSR